MRFASARLQFVVSIALLAAAANGTFAQATKRLPNADLSANDSKANIAGIRTVTGRHLVLYTDLPASDAVDSLPALFDAAVPLWAAYFGVDPAAIADWRVRAHLIGDRTKFAAVGLMPADNTLVHGYATGTDLWVLDQPTDYYRRHLLLHEGTHAFMTQFLGGCGPGWYAEGMAELLATHRMGVGSGEPGAERSQSLQLNVMPRDRREVPMLGRIKLVRDAVAANRAFTFPQVIGLDNRSQLSNEQYAWCWAAAKFLDSHPRYRQRFRELAKHTSDPKFNQRVRRTFAGDWAELLAEWQAYVATLDHGYDFERTAIDFQRGTPLGGEPRQSTIAADRCWQSSGVWLEGGKTYKIAARGRFQIAVEDGTPWPCEPGGVTIQYHEGRPLGMLLGAIMPDKAGGATFAKPLAIGLGSEITPTTSGTLYLRVNDSAARLSENDGDLTIRIAD